MDAEPRTAIVTGAARRVGRAIAEALLADGWTVVAHVRRAQDDAPDGTVKAVADLGQEDCATRIFAAARGLPPVRLLVNNAARFAWDSLGEPGPNEFDRHMAVNVRAPLLLTSALAHAHRAGEEALVVNLLDSKLSGLNADFLSYTLSKQALAGLTELAARSLAPKGIRVNGIAPALMLRSAGQSERNFERMHAANPLGRGVEPEHVIAAIRFLAESPVITGQILTIDGGHRFLGLERDVQFLDEGGAS
ncbi:MAG TPA: SDR family oxidoreductase [Sphingomicrobium sp.]|nr:SDR family oxidoreductase [Sphingomicrobium sp.]